MPEAYFYDRGVCDQVFCFFTYFFMRQAGDWSIAISAAPD